MDHSTRANFGWGSLPAARGMALMAVSMRAIGRICDVMVKAPPFAQAFASTLVRSSTTRNNCRQLGLRMLQPCKHAQGTVQNQASNHWRKLQACNAATGSWRNDEQHGHGKAVYPDGSYYEGTWKHGVRYVFCKPKAGICMPNLVGVCASLAGYVDANGRRS